MLIAFVLRLLFGGFGDDAFAILRGRYRAGGGLSTVRQSRLTWALAGGFSAALVPQLVEKVAYSINFDAFRNSLPQRSGRMVRSLRVREVPDGLYLEGIAYMTTKPVSYTHLTLPTIYSV